MPGTSGLLEVNSTMWRPADAREVAGNRNEDPTPNRILELHSILSAPAIMDGCHCPSRRPPADSPRPTAFARCFGGSRGSGRPSVGTSSGSESVDLNDPTTAALATAEALRAAGVPHALYGGLLLAAYGEPRETRDVDIAVVDADAEAVGRHLAGAGIETRLVFKGQRFGGLLIDRLTLLGGEGDTGLNVLGLVRPRSDRYRQLALDRCVRAPLRDEVIPVLVPEDFVLFKVLSTRDRDLEDAASVVRRLGGSFARDLVDEECDRLSREIPDHEVRHSTRIILASNPGA